MGEPEKVVRVEDGATITLEPVEGTLIVGRHATVRGGGHPPVLEVSGPVKCLGPCVFECSLKARRLEARRGPIEVLGDLEVEDRVKVRNGSLEVSGSAGARLFEVEGELRVDGELRAREVRVGGYLTVGGRAEVGLVDVGGSLLARDEFKADEVRVGGKARFDGDVDIGRLSVGGTARARGGRISEVDVGGSFKALSALKFDKISVGGVAVLAEGEGGNISVGGSFRSQGPLKRFGSLSVGGTVSIMGPAKGTDVSVGGTLKVLGDLELEGKLRVGGTASIEGTLKASSVSVGGSLRADKVKADRDLRVGGLLATKEGAEADYIEIGRKGRVKGPLRARRVTVGEKARVEDVWAEEITLEEGARARNLYGIRIYVERDCVVLGDVKYVEEFVAEEGARFLKAPEKVGDPSEIGLS